MFQSLKSHLANFQMLLFNFDGSRKNIFSNNFKRKKCYQLKITKTQKHLPIQNLDSTWFDQAENLNFYKYKLCGAMPHEVPSVVLDQVTWFQKLIEKKL